MFMCAHVCDVALCGNTVKMWLLGSDWLATPNLWYSNTCLSFITTVSKLTLWLRSWRTEIQKGRRSVWEQSIVWVYCVPGVWYTVAVCLLGCCGCTTDYWSTRNIWRHISLIWPFPHRYRHSPWPVDVMELFHRFCCWTLIWLSRHWAWLRWGYWRYRSLIDLIDWLIDVHPHVIIIIIMCHL